MAYEIDSFVQKFKNLWHAGRNASLCIKSVGGKAHVDLSVELGEASRTAAHHFRSRNGPARQRRRDRRAAAREEVAEDTPSGSTAVEADPNVNNSVEDAAEEDATDEDAAEEAIAEKATAEKAIAEEEVDIGKEITAAEAASDSCEFSCDLCDNKFKSARGLRTHEG